MSEEIKESLHAGAVEISRAIKEYYPESDPLVLSKLEKWQNLKFGLLIHWAPSSQWGIVESWSLCSEDEEWCKRKIEDYCEYKKQYENLMTTFNPLKFNPKNWAEAAEYAGMKYFIFTTKHHDGFCMFDTKYTDYKITSKRCPFHKNPNSNITRVLFNEFRKRNFMIGAYFSKPDWHSDYYWWRKFATPDRNVNYDIKKYPERWQKFVEFTHNQIDELMSDYGTIDILWLDGCWVRKYSEEELEEERKKASFNIYRIQNQDINMPLLVKNARLKQPGLIVVDRAVPGIFQNYLTPENQIPDKPLPYPWETCMPMTASWSYEPGLEYKSKRYIIHSLIKIVSRGGNFLLNIGPKPDGEFEDEAYNRLKEIGEWMKINSEAIYNTKPLFPYEENNFFFTQLNDKINYAFYLIEGNNSILPEQFIFEKFYAKNIRNISLINYNINLSWINRNNKIIIYLPEEIRNRANNDLTLTIKIIKE